MAADAYGSLWPWIQVCKLPNEHSHILGVHNRLLARVEAEAGGALYMDARLVEQQALLR